MPNVQELRGWIVVGPENAIVGPHQSAVTGLVVLAPQGYDKCLIYYDKDLRSLQYVKEWKKQ